MASTLAAVGRLRSNDPAEERSDQVQRRLFSRALQRPAFTNYHVGGNEFLLLSELRSRADDYRFGADGRLGPIDFSVMQGFRRFRDDTFIDSGANPGLNVNPTTAHLTVFTATNQLAERSTTLV
jgi:hypothetical protein